MEKDIAKNRDTLTKAFNSLFKVGTGGAIVLALGLATVYFSQGKMLYHPAPPGFQQYSQHNPYGYRHPSEQGLISEDILIKTSDNLKLKGWFLKQKSDYQTIPTIVFFHENAGNIGTRLEYLKNYMNLVNVNIMIVAYRGYSDSEKCTPSEEGLQKDSLAILKYAFGRQDIDKTRIFTHGRSLGGATSLYAVIEGEFPVAGCIIENTFASIDSMSKIILPKFITVFNKFLLKNHWDTISRIAKLKQSALFIKTVNDEIVPYDQMNQLQQMATSCEWVEEVVLTTGGHNDNWQQNVQEYFENVDKFILKNIMIKSKI